MEKKRMIIDAAVYVGTYGKYSRGSIDGRWFYLSQYDDYESFIEACKAYHKDETEPELMFQGWEYIPKGMISESSIYEGLWELMEDAKDLSDDELKAFCVWLSREDDDVLNEPDELIERFRDAYFGEFLTEKDFGIEAAGLKFGSLLETSPLGMYFDYDAYARDLLCGNYYKVDLHYFSRYQ